MHDGVGIVLEVGKKAKGGNEIDVSPAGMVTVPLA
jgi:hypothetical protein